MCGCAAGPEHTYVKEGQYDKHTLHSQVTSSPSGFDSTCIGLISRGIWCYLLAADEKAIALEIIIYLESIDEPLFRDRVEAFRTPTMIS